MRIKKWLVIVFVLFSFVNTAFVVAAPSAGDTRIIIYHVNDLHSQIDRFSKIAWQVREEKKNNPGAHVFFLNAGDNFSGNPVVDRYNPPGEPVRLLLNKMDIDVMSMGNHDFDTGPAAAKTFLTTAKYPVVSANIKIKSADLPQFKPYYILNTGKNPETDKSNIKIAVLGLIQVEESGTPSTHPKNIQGIEFTDPVKTAETYRSLGDENDVFIVLSHMGYDTDLELARKMGNIDAIVGGHSHTRLDKPRMENNVLIAQAGGYGWDVGRIELVLRNKKVVSKTAKLIKVSSIVSSVPELDGMIKKFNDNPVLEEVITTLPRVLSGKDQLGHLSTDAARKRFKLDITFQNAGGIRIHKLGPEVRLKDIYSLHPFKNRIVKIKMTLDEIKGFIKYDFEKHKNLDARVSGINYVVWRDVSGKVSRIYIMDGNGAPLSPKRLYNVGINDYMLGKYKFPHRDPGESLMVTLADTVADYLKEEKNAWKNVDKIRAYESLVPESGLNRIGTTGVKLSAGDFPFLGSSPTGNLAADAVRDATSADFALFPTSAAKLNLIITPNSILFREYIPLIFPFSEKTKMVTGKMKGKDIQEFLLNRAKLNNNVDIQVSGLDYTLISDKDGNIKDIVIRLPGKKKLSNHMLYTVSLNQYHYKKYYKLGSKFRNLSVSKTTIAQMIENYIRKVKKIGKRIRQMRVIIRR